MTNAFKRTPVTVTLIVIQVLVFIAMELSGGSTNTVTLLNFGAEYPPLLAAGQCWRLITPSFVHIGIMHLLLNSIVLYYMGNYVEQLFGHWQLILIYLISVISGNLLSAALSPTSIAAGSSTGIFGLFGAFIFLGTEHRQQPFLRILTRQYIILMVINLAFDLISPSIDIWGHLGGLFAGFLAGALFDPEQFGKIRLVKRLLSAIILILILVSLMRMVLVNG